jgi:uncharacterized membrane protein
MGQTIVSFLPPWALLAALLGVMHGALFHLLFGRALRQLPAGVAIGLVGSVAGGLIGTMIPPAVLMVGETNLIATTLAAWAGLGIARLFRFC